MAGTDAEPRYESEITEIYDIHGLKDFASETLVRKKLFKTEQIW
jgi:hypothetical protein